VVPVCADVELYENVSDSVCLAVVVEKLFVIVIAIAPPEVKGVRDNSVTVPEEMDRLVVIVIAIASPEVKAVGNSVTEFDCCRKVV
jgi:hypothetical protein